MGPNRLFGRLVHPDIEPSRFSNKWLNLEFGNLQVYKDGCLSLHCQTNTKYQTHHKRTDRVSLDETVFVPRFLSAMDNKFLLFLQDRVWVAREFQIRAVGN